MVTPLRAVSASALPSQARDSYAGAALRARAGRFAAAAGRRRKGDRRPREVSPTASGASSSTEATATAATRTTSRPGTHQGLGQHAARNAMQTLHRPLAQQRERQDRDKRHRDHERRAQWRVEEERADDRGESRRPTETATTSWFARGAGHVSPTTRARARASRSRGPAGGPSRNRAGAEHRDPGHAERVCPIVARAEEPREHHRGEERQARVQDLQRERPGGRRRPGPAPKMSAVIALPDHSRRVSRDSTGRAARARTAPSAAGSSRPARATSSRRTGSRS